MSKDFYDKMGASATKEQVHNAIKNLDKGIFPNAFCKILQDPADKDYAMIIHADGAGTKVLIAYLYYLQTGDASYFTNPAIDSVVMNIDDMACVGVVDNIVLSNTIDRNAHKINGDIVSSMIKGYDDFLQMLKKQGINIIDGGGETADVGDLVSTVTMNSTCFARLPKSKIISFDKVCAGNVIVGLASFGKANYETKENSGIGSNGFTAARHALLKKEYAKKYPQIVNASIADVGYQGKYALDDKLPNSSMTIGEALLSPTRTYVPVLKDLLTNNFEIVNGIIHNTGGGLTKSQKFGKGLHFVKDNLFVAPPIFDAIFASGKLEQKEMYKVFNMGQRLEIYCKKENAQAIIDKAKEYGIDAKIIGRVEKSNGANKVTIIDKGKTFEY